MPIDDDLFGTEVRIKYRTEKGGKRENTVRCRIIRPRDQDPDDVYVLMVVTEPDGYFPLSEDEVKSCVSATTPPSSPGNRPATTANHPQGGVMGLLA